MAYSDYKIIIKDAVGNVLIPAATGFSKLTYSRAVNTPGTFEMKFIDLTPDSAAQLGLMDTYGRMKPMGRVEIMRSINGGPMFLDFDTAYFITNIARDGDNLGNFSFTIKGTDTIGLLAHKATTPDATSTTVVKAATYLDDMLKTIFSEQYGAGSLTDWSAWISVAPNLGAAQSLAQKFANQNVLSAMQKIAQASTAAGTYLAFDIFADGSNSFQFRTYTGQRGQDRRRSQGNGILLNSSKWLNYHYEIDYSNVKSYVIAGTQTANDAVTDGLSPFGRVVEYLSVPASNTDAQNLAAAWAELRSKRPKVIASVELAQTDGCFEGLHYRYGDFLSLDLMGVSLDVHFDAVTRTIEGGKDVVTAILRTA